MAKIILTHEVSGLGEPGDIVEVKDGYARNYLVPRGLATRWTKGAQKQVDSIRAARRKREIASIEDARAVRDAIEGTTIVIKQRAGESGRLFGAVSTATIAEAIAEQTHHQVDKSKIEVGAPIKAVGDYTATIKLHPEVVAKVSMEVAAAE